jgi:hypothetical protein
VLTEKRSLENYVHWEAIRAARGVNMDGTCPADSLRRNRGREPPLDRRGQISRIKRGLITPGCLRLQGRRRDVVL